MKRRKFLVGSAAILSGTGLISSSQGFSRVESERETKITVEDDESAYLNLRYDSSHDFDCEKDIALIEIGNQTTEPLHSVEIEFSEIPETILVTDGETALDSGDTLSVVDASDAHDVALGIGDSEWVELTAECEGESASGDIEFDVVAEGDDTSIETNRPEVVSIECDCPEEDDGESEGNCTGGSNGNINTPLDLPGVPDDADPDNVKVIANDNGGKELDIIQNGNGNSEQYRIDYECGDLGCEDPSDKITLTVEGKTENGDTFSETIDCVSCNNRKCN